MATAGSDNLGRGVDDRDELRRVDGLSVGSPRGGMEVTSAGLVPQTLRSFPNNAQAAQHGTRTVHDDQRGSGGVGEVDGAVVAGTGGSGLSGLEIWRWYKILAPRHPSIPSRQHLRPPPASRVRITAARTQPFTLYHKITKPLSAVGDMTPSNYLAFVTA